MYRNIVSVEDGTGEQTFRKEVKMSRNRGLTWTQTIFHNVYITDSYIEKKVHFGKQQKDSLCWIGDTG